MSKDNDVEGLEQVPVEDSGATAGPCVQQPEQAENADAFPATSKQPKEKKCEKLSHKPLRLHRRFKKQRNEEELAVMKTLAVSVAAPDSTNSVPSLHDEGEDASFGRYVICSR
jgi:hypothetical protein